MCDFFSFVTDIHGNKYYFNEEQRNTVCKEQLYQPDSHTSIADYYGFKGVKEDKLNKYEYNPLNKKLVQDTISFEEDFNGIKEWCDNLDFSTISLKCMNIQRIFNEWENNIGRQVKLTKPMCDGDGYYGCAEEVKDQIGIVQSVDIDGEYVRVRVSFPGWCDGSRFSANAEELELV